MERHSAGRIFSRTFALLAARPLPAILALPLLAGPAAAMEAAGLDWRMVNFVGILSLFVQYGVTRRLLDRLELIRQDYAGRAGAFVILSIVSSLAITLGVVLLVLPGLFLAARWAVTVPLVIGEGDSFSDSLRNSWARTGPSTIGIMAVLAVFGLPLVGGTVLNGFLYPEAGPVPIELTLAVNALLYATLILGWYMAVALYVLTLPEDEVASLERVFE